MRTKRNTKIPNKFEDSVHSINNSKTNNKTASKKIDVSKKNSYVFGNGTEKDKESAGSEGSNKDDCVVTNDEREKIDARSKDVLENIAGIDGITSIEEIAEKVQSGNNPVNDLANDETAESSDKNKGKSNGKHVENCHKEVIVALKTYAHIVKHDDLPKNLNYIPTLITESDNEVVIFDEVLVNKGSERWNLTLCEAWSMEGISAIEISLGKPMMMDTNTAAMCHKGIGVLKKLDRIMSNEGFIKDFPQAHANFQDIQIFIDVDPYDQSLRIKEAKLVEEFCEAESDEEIFLHQQAKIKWLCDGDKNSRYFHRVLKGMNNKRKVFSLSDNHGNSYDYDQIPQLFLKHFENFLGSTYPVQEIKSSETLFKEKLSTADTTKLIADISDYEIKRALFDIKDTKAPGPDGFTAAFFKQA
nr:hypothetical protein [Tanacetum cinerariifolium]